MTVKPEWALRILDTLASSIAWLQERAAMVERPMPDTPDKLVAWALDELTIQIHQAQSHPDKADERLSFASEMAFLASVLLWQGARPAFLPWEKSTEGGE
ncbi:MAG: hypothetical protein GY851_24635 [bacterium]|nr:hypothetical protein [bacterium]